MQVLQYFSGRDLSSPLPALPALLAALCTLLMLSFHAAARIPTPIDALMTWQHSAVLQPPHHHHLGSMGQAPLCQRHPAAGDSPAQLPSTSQLPEKHTAPRQWRFGHTVPSSSPKMTPMRPCPEPNLCLGGAAEPPVIAMGFQQRSKGGGRAEWRAGANNSHSQHLQHSQWGVPQPWARAGIAQNSSPQDEAGGGEAEIYTGLPGFQEERIQKAHLQKNIHQECAQQHVNHPSAAA